MKTFISFLFALIAVTAVHSQQPDPLNDIIKKRDALLSKIVDITRTANKQGTATEEQLIAASLNLFCFRRDAAKTQPERIQWQERIVTIVREERDAVKKRVEIGVVTALGLMIEEERVLEAEQKLLELQLAK